MPAAIPAMAASSPSLAAATAAARAQPAAQDTQDTAWDTCTRWERVGDGSIATSRLQFSGLYCAACAGLIEDALREEPGVLSAALHPDGRRGSVRWDPARTGPARLLAAVARAGYGAAADAEQPAHALRQRESRAALWRLFVAGFCMSQAMMYTAPFYFAAPGSIAPDLAALLLWAAWLLTLPVMLFSARPLFEDAWRGLVRGQVRMELPAALGIAVTFVASTLAAFGPPGEAATGPYVYFDSLTMFVCFLLGGRWLVLRARDRVAGALEAAASRLPARVSRLDADGRPHRVALQTLRPGDRLLVAAGEAFAADGPLLEGNTRADEALLTGESRPVHKGPGDEAIAGSINLGAPVVQRADRLGPDTRYEGIVALLQGTLAQRPALLRAADRVARPFLWGVLLLAGGTALAWQWIDPARAMAVAVAVLVVTCPCALSLAAPAALLAAAGALAKRGVLVQRLDALEALATADLLFFDKTGTLTEDRLVVHGIVPEPAARAQEWSDAALLLQAASLAALSQHPASRAIVAHAADAGLPAMRPVHWRDVQELAGCGIAATDGAGARWRLGSHAWAAGPAAAPVPDGSAVWVACQGVLLGHLPFAEALRPDAAATLAALRADGVALALLSGDAPAHARQVARRLGLADASGGASPEDKLGRITAAQQAGRCVGMVGDGLNDAPVIARADVSFSFAHGSAVTRSKADFILLSPRLADIAVARAVARRALRIVRQNLAWSVAYNAVCVPLALAGLFPPWAAGLGMAASSLGVVLNALRAGRDA